MCFFVCLIHPSVVYLVTFNFISIALYADSLCIVMIIYLFLCGYETSCIAYPLSQDQLCGRDPTLTEELMAMLTEFTQLSKTTNAKVALRARQVRC